MTRHATRRRAGPPHSAHIRLKKEASLFILAFSYSSSSSLSSVSSSLSPPVRDRPGLLFSKDALPQRVAHGDAVEVGVSQWRACVESDFLVLKNIVLTDDKKERTTSRIADIKREVEGRQQELEALTADIDRVEVECEAVIWEEEEKGWEGRGWGCLMC